MTDPDTNRCDGCSADLPVFGGAFCDVCADDFAWDWDGDPEEDCA